MISVVQSCVDALSLGVVYALYALGVGLIFGVARIINFAHGELIMIAAYLVFVVVTYLTAAWPLVVGASILGVVAVALLIERVSIRPFRGADQATILVATFAVSVLLQNIVLLSAGARAKTLDFGSDLISSVNVAGVTMETLDLVKIGVGAVCLFGLLAFLRLTPAGLQLRAAAEDFEMARILGVPANRVVALAFLLSGILAGVAGVLFVVEQGAITPDLGLQPLLIAFVATVIGGMGSLRGAVLAGFLLGAATVILQARLPGDLAPYRDAFLFLGVILVLLVRPQGLLPGPQVEERV